MQPPLEPLSLDCLTPRQRETVELYSKGLVLKQVAHQMGISLSTVKVTVANAYGRLGIRNIQELAYRIGLRDGIARVRDAAD
jgi:DNA-binding NarL/FixJ family response regulator